MTITKEDVEKILRDYKKIDTTIGELQDSIDGSEDLLKRDPTEQTKEETIEAMQLNSPAISDIPRSNTNKISRTVENTLLGYENEMRIEEIDRYRLKDEIRTWKQQQDTLKRKRDRINNLLKVLNEPEDLVIRGYYIDIGKWDYVANKYFEKYQQTRTVNQLKNIRDTALDKILEVVLTPKKIYQ
jgi:predicted translin family RNA/ssDNA-binding protein